MQCPSCHATIEPGLVFCPECGARLSPTAAPPPLPTATGYTTSLAGALPAYADQYGALPPIDPLAAQSTRLAQVSRWMGLISAGVMVVATLLIIGGTAMKSDGGAVLAGFGFLIVLPALLCGPVAALMGLLALTNPHTATTAFGRRHATIGAAAGLVTLLLCCIGTLILGAQTPVEGTLPQVVAFSALSFPLYLRFT